MTDLAARLDLLADRLHADSKLKQDTIVLGVVAALREEAAALRTGPERRVEFTCSICLYDSIDWSTLSEDQLAERDSLTVINGQMTCEYHASIVGGREHGLALMDAKKHGMRKG